MKRPLKFPLDYEKGIRHVCRKGTTKEAEKPFQEFYAHQLRQATIRKYGRADEKIVQKRLKENIDHLRENGFDQEFFEMCCHHYAQMPRRARREKVKKQFDAKGLPKMPNTPVNRAIMREFIEIRERSLAEKSASGGLKVPKRG